MEKCPGPTFRVCPFKELLRVCFVFFQPLCYLTVCPDYCGTMNLFIPKPNFRQSMMCSPNVLCSFFIAYRFQIAGYRDVHEYRDVKQKEPVSCPFCFHSVHMMELGGGGGGVGVIMKHHPDDRNEKIM